MKDKKNINLKGKDIKEINSILGKISRDINKIVNNNDQTNKKK